jgi:hypothetical protein
VLREIAQFVGNFRRQCVQCGDAAQLDLFPLLNSMSANVQRFPKAREPTDRAAEGFPPPSPGIHLHRPRWQGAKRRRGKRVLDTGKLAGCLEWPLPSGDDTALVRVMTLQSET